MATPDLLLTPGPGPICSQCPVSGAPPRCFLLKFRTEGMYQTVLRITPGAEHSDPRQARGFLPKDIPHGGPLTCFRSLLERHITGVTLT